MAKIIGFASPTFGVGTPLRKILDPPLIRLCTILHMLLFSGQAGKIGQSAL